MVNLTTCSWRAYRPQMGVAVRITLGRPPRWFRHPWEEIRLLAPPPAVFRLKDDSEFEVAYLEHLEAVGVDRIRLAFERVSEDASGRTLVLLCFEADPNDCHRRQFAEWWESKTGENVAELPDGGTDSIEDNRGGQPTLFEEGDQA